MAQVARPGCERILTSEWPDKAGNGLMFISLDGEVLNALRAELEGRGVDVKDGHWGYRLMVIVAPDGRIGTRKHFSRDPSAGVSPHRAPPSRPAYQ